MRILFLTSRFPWPPNRGDRLRTYHLLRKTAAVHDVHLLSLVEAPPSAEDLTALRTAGVSVEPVRRTRAASLAALAVATLSPLPFQVAYYRSAAMRRRVAERAGDFDVVIAHLIRMAPYLDEVPERVRRIVDLCDCISSEYRASLPHRSGIRRAFFRAEAERVAAMERQLTERTEECWVISSAEADKLGGGTRLHVVPNGVEIPPDAPAQRAPGPPRFLFTGNLSVPHNVDAARHLCLEVLPRIRHALGEVRVTLAGADPVASVRELAGPDIIVPGWVADFPALLQGADVFIAPMRFVAGVQNKVLEAMAAGTPVVTSAAVAAGVGAEDGTHLHVGGSPEELAVHAVALVREPERARAMGAAGRTLVRERFSWTSVLDRLSAGRAPAP